MKHLNLHKMSEKHKDREKQEFQLCAYQTKTLANGDQNQTTLNLEVHLTAGQQKKSMDDSD